MSQSTPPPLGGRYELRRQLATTPAARVYLAQDLELGRPVAIKVLGPDLARDPQVVARFQQAANTAAAVHDPRIVTIYDTGEDHGAVYVAMEYVDGASLSDTLRDAHRLGVAPTINMGVSVAQALDAAHRAGLVHGSLKPRDVLLGRDGSVKVTDFGTATAGLASLAGPVAVATYGAPEQLQGQAPDARSDLYALGVLLYESVTGAPPFTGDDATAITQRKLTERVLPASVSMPAIPPGFDAIVDRLLDRDPSRRYGSGGEVAADLVRLGETAQVPIADPTQALPVVAAVPTTPRPVVPPVETDEEDDEKKRGATPWIIAAIVILVLAVGGLAAWAFTKDDAEKKAMVQVPAVVGARVADATATLEAAKLSPSTQNEPNDSFGKGLVFEQAPKAGTQAREGSVVVIKVSSGPSTTTSSSSSTSTSTSSSTSTTSSTTTTTTTTTTPPDSSTTSTT